jgi:hypothetical protein
MSTGVYAKTAGDLIRDALRAATISGISLPVQSEDFAQGESALNDILMSLQTEQIHVWAQTEALIPLNPDQTKYVFGTDHAFTNYVYTTASAAIATATSLTVVSTTGMTAGDFIGVELADGTRQWTTLTVTGATTLTLAAALTGAVDDLASIYTYTTATDQPVRIDSVRYADTYTSDEISTSMVARDEYFNQPSKTTSGAVNTWYFQRNLDFGHLYIWPIADNCKRLLRITFIKPQYIPEDQSEDILIPPEWYVALKFKLAADLAISYGVDPNRQMMLEQKAAIYLQKAISSDDDGASFQFTPSR